MRATKYLIIGLVLMLIPACATTPNVFYEDLFSIVTSNTFMVEQYEAVAFNLRKIHDGITYLCQDNRQGCSEIRSVYAKTRVAFINQGNSLIELIQAKEGTPQYQKALSKYVEDTKKFEILYNELKRRAVELGMGGIDK